MKNEPIEIVVPSTPSNFQNEVVKGAVSAVFSIAAAVVGHFLVKRMSVVKVAKIEVVEPIATNKK